MFIVTADQMRDLDHHTIRTIGIPGPVLMENAGRGTLEVMRRVFPDLEALRVAVVCGRGNNGGDGFVIARGLIGWGAEVDVFLTGSIDGVSGDARINLDALTNLGAPVKRIDTKGDDGRGLKPGEIKWDAYGLIVDALFGTGLNAEVRTGYAEIIDGINVSGAKVVAVDIPSGLSSDRGVPLGTAVKADVTVTFGLPKLGHFIARGDEHCGDLYVTDIGIPPSVVESKGLKRRVIEPDTN